MSLVMSTSVTMVSTYRDKQALHSVLGKYLHKPIELLASSRAISTHHPRQAPALILILEI